MMERIKYQKWGIENDWENKILRRVGIENDDDFFEKRRYKIMENIKSRKIRYRKWNIEKKEV